MGLIEIWRLVQLRSINRVVGLMPHSEFRLRGLTIDSFRGFRDPATFDLDASTVIFTGPNGTGKTSVFDALQWVMLGSIERLEGLRSRKNVEHVVSSYRPGGRARLRRRSPVQLPRSPCGSRAWTARCAPRGEAPRRSVLFVRARRPACAGWSSVSRSFGWVGWNDWHLGH